jgi:hypothetical protein
MKPKSFFFWFFCLFVAEVSAQSVFAPLNEDYYHRLDRYEVKMGKIYPQLFTTVKQYKRSQIVAYLDSVNADGGLTTRSNAFNYTYFLTDNWEWSNSETAKSKQPVLKHFYKSKPDFYHVRTRDFDVHISPVLYAGAGQDSRRPEALFVNTRGVEVRGMVDNKVGFYTYLTDNQAILPLYVTELQNKTLALPHEGFWKRYKQGPGVDFLQARGYISFEATKHINLQAGHDRFFIGNGHRSMILSDNAAPALFFKGNVKVWKLNYLWLVNRLVADVAGNTSGLTGNERYPDKYMAFHHFSFNIGKKLNVGIFESVIFGTDSAYRFDAAYLNPIIFYRAIEQQNGSSDNVLIGADIKWNLLKGVQFYGQLTLDEFVISNVRARNGWRANKFGAQAGIKYIDALGVSNLDLQGEVNVARPYMYSHSSAFGNYSNYRQPLAHPLGANFTEVVALARYQPLPRVNITAKLIAAQIGRDTTGVNWGSDILLNPESVPIQREFGNTIGQGVHNDILYASFTLSWMVKHNIFIDAAYILRDSHSPVGAYNTKTTVTSVALRWNIAQRHYEF